ncbi:hypothetical protein CCYA_CCYA16G4234 [Cyanidiococcus yangmingshanensis]|uniref:Nascent polypeptide-associated complex subunit beta n=1 Tax=Cyanidiococcus yangmingshanensis TaxID=2690220 RepID=A0A7J7IFS6_9RHOD|nr:nascent polypeptide-associated complex beta subunit [Cyanidiococcus yangmingshanensis]KAK4533352.1 hypothetical protein CCYA_CCYA16G4234 [Cyanidiococcus yangmingshanensis]
MSGATSEGNTAGAEETTVNRERLQRLQRLSEQVRLGGKGSMRRKKKAAGTRSSATDDKKLHAAIKRMGLSQVPQIDEVNMFKEDGTVLTFAMPKLQANISANTYVMSGSAPQQRRLEDLLDDVGMLSQLGPENLAQIQQLMQQLSAQEKPSDVPDVPDADFEAAATQPTDAPVTS